MKGAAVSEVTQPQTDERAQRRQEHADSIVKWIRSRLYADEPAGITEIEPLPLFRVAGGEHD
jgi:hypothetical protein